MKKFNLKNFLFFLICISLIAFLPTFLIGCGGGQAVVTPQIPEETDSSVVLDYNASGLTTSERNRLFSGELTVGRVDTQVTIKSLPTIETGGLDGWVIKNTNTFVNVGDVIEDGTTLQAKYTEYTVTYNLNMDGATLSSPKKKYTIKDTFTLKEPTCAGQTFMGWKLSGETDTTTRVSKLTKGNLVFEASWEIEIFILTDNNISGLSDYGKTLTSLTITNKVGTKTITGINEGAFANCTSLEAVTFVGNVPFTDMGNSIFAGCPNLTSITINKTKEEAFELFLSADIISATLHCSDGNIENYGTIISYILTDGSKQWDLSTSEEWYEDLISVNIPVAVTEIPEWAFSGFENITSISIPNGVTTIGESAFWSCKGLTEITIPESVENIGGWAFYYCSSLKSITLPVGVTVLEDQLFSDCSSLESIEILGNITSVKNRAFYGCYDVEITIDKTKEEFKTLFAGAYIPKATVHCSDGDLENYGTIITFHLNNDRMVYDYSAWGDYKENVISVNIPSEITRLYDDVFKGCVNLTSITIPEYVTRIGSNAFYMCTSLADIYMTSKTKEEFRTFFADTAVINATAHCQDGNIENFGTVISYTLNDGSKQYSKSANSSWASNVTSAYIPNMVVLPFSAFKNCTSLSNITIPATVTEIGGSAFYGCTSLSNITIPASVTNIGDSAFYGCTALSNITIPANVTKIGSYAFYGCTALSNITIPEGVTLVRSYAFSNCNNLTSISMNVTKNAFIEICKDCGVLDITVHCSDGDILNYGTVITFNLNDSTKQYGTVVDSSWASSVTSVNIPYGVRRIEQDAFYNCTNLTSIVLPESVAFIGYRAFRNCTSLTTITMSTNVISMDIDAFYNCSSLTSIIIPNGVKTIYSHAFYNCRSLTNVTISENATQIQLSAFEKCSSLTSITIPSKVTSIYNSTFSDCTSLTTITIQGDLTDVGTDVFKNCSALTDIHTPNITKEEFMELFENASIISVTAHCSDGDIENYGTRITFNLNDSTKQYGTAVNSSWASSVISVNVPLGIYSIPNNAFKGCIDLSTISLPNSITSIGSYAFKDCTNLLSLTLPNSLTDIGSSILTNCNSLSTITTGFTKEEFISKFANANVHEVSVVHCSDGDISHYGNYIAYHFSGGTTIYDLQVTSISGSLSDIVSVDIPIGVVSLRYMALANCTNLTSVTIPNTVNSIESSVFSGCTSLTTITIQGNLTTVGTYIFNNCSALTDIYTPNITKEEFIQLFKQASIIGATIHCSDGNIDSYGTIITFNLSDGTKQFGTAVNSSWASQVTSVNMPYGLTAIANNAFYNCTNLTSVTLPTTVTAIGDFTFFNTGISTITIPASVTTIGQSAIRACTNLTTVTFAENSLIATIGIYAFYGNTALQSFVFPQNSYLTAIPQGCFNRCSSLRTVTIPNTITSIGAYAFNSCSMLQSITLPSGLTGIIEEFTFNNCSRLTSITIPENITKVWTKAFAECPSLQNVTISKTKEECIDFLYYGGIIEATVHCSDGDLTGYGSSIAYRLSDGTTKYRWAGETSSASFAANVQQIMVPTIGIKTLSVQVFSGCTNLVKVYIPKSVTSIASDALKNCSNLSAINFDDRTAEEAISLLKRCSVLVKDVLLYCSDTTIPYGTLIRYTLQDGTYKYATVADSSWAAQVTDVAIPNNMTSLRTYAFKNCTRITNVTIPSNIVQFSSYVFSGCTNLTTIVLQCEVTGDDRIYGATYLFSGCSNLTTVKIESQSVIDRSYDIMDDISNSTNADICLKDGLTPSAFITTYYTQVTGGTQLIGYTKWVKNS